MAKFELKPFHKNITDDELLEDLRRVALLLDKKTVRSEPDYKEHGKYSDKPFRRFGKWSDALKKAGLQESRPPINIPEEELFENLQNVWIKLGKQPVRLDMRKPLSRFSVTTYENRFGSWRKALEKFVESANLDETYDSDNFQSSRGNAPKSRTPRDPDYRLKYKVLKRDKFKCCVCGRSPASDPGVILHIDHIVPWSKGGETKIENLQTLCSVCNIGKSNLD